MKYLSPFANALRWARTQKNLSLEQLAKKIGRPRSKGYLSMMENGVCPPPSQVVIDKLARVLGVSAGELSLVAFMSKAPVCIRSWVHDIMDEVELSTIPTGGLWP